MGGGGGLGGIVSAVTNPIGTIANAVAPGSDVARLTGKYGAIAGPAGILGQAAYNRANPQPRPGAVPGGVSTQVMPGSYQGQDYDALGRPILRDFDTQLQPNGMLKDQYLMKNNLNTQGLEQIRNEALRSPGTQSRWAEIAKADAANTAAAQNAGQMAQARSGLAMQGGLRSGARERLAQQGQVAGLQAKQNANMQVNMQDEQNRQKWLAMLPSQELAAAQFGSTIENQNIGRSLNELQQGRDFDKYRYGQAMTAWGADKSSQAMRQAAEDAKSTSGLFGGGGFLGLGI